jgi:hypothetical protein
MEYPLVLSESCLKAPVIFPRLVRKVVGFIVAVSVLRKDAAMEENLGIKCLSVSRKAYGGLPPQINAICEI